MPINWPLPLVVTLTRIAPRSLDSDNLASAAKACRDGISDALGIDDGAKGLTWLYAQRKGKPHEVALEVRIQRVQADTVQADGGAL